jgi:hypothetical protein
MQIQPTNAKPHRKEYAVDQCALFKLESKGRLALLLFTELSKLERFAELGDGNYKLFPLKAVTDPFSKPRKGRDVQEPKTELRQIHDRIHKLLKRVNCPEYLHSAIKGRSYKTNAKAHVGQSRLLKLDVRKFYPTTTESRVYNFFRDEMQSGHDVSGLLARLCTWNGSLATGSPLSPLLSYYANKPMFYELSEMARSRELKFSCYVDDLTFSGDKISLGLAEQVSTS